jgi:hypothetical protein
MNLVPFESIPELLEAAANGIAVSVILDTDSYEKQYAVNYHTQLGWTQDVKIHPDVIKFCTILSEIKNMPGHYVVAGRHGQIVAGLHGDIFMVDKDEFDDAEELNEYLSEAEDLGEDQ